jgi:uncharacterized membrane protein YdcZ (DUF606 family)
MLFWYNLYSLPVYLLIIPLEAVPYINGKETGSTLGEAFTHQLHALACFVNSPYQEDVVSGDCQSGAQLWPLIFVAGYAGMFFIQAVIIKHYNVVLMTVLTALIQPLAACVFSSSAIVGSHTSPMSTEIILAIVLTLVGVAIKGAGKSHREAAGVAPASPHESLLSVESADAALTIPINDKAMAGPRRHDAQHTSLGNIEYVSPNDASGV